MLKNVRVWIFIILLVFSIISIHPVINKDGVAIRNVIKESAAAKAGIESPNPRIVPTKREIINSINNQLIKNLQDYDNAVNLLKANQTVRIATNKNTYVLRTIPLTETTILNETEWVNKTFTENNKTYSKLILENKTKTEIIGMQDIGIKVYEKPGSNIRKGLDLQGGTRVLLQPENETPKEDMDFILDNMKQRLNVYGLTDLTIKSASEDRAQAMNLSSLASLQT